MDSLTDLMVAQEAEIDELHRRYLLAPLLDYLGTLPAGRPLTPAAVARCRRIITTGVARLYGAGDDQDRDLADDSPVGLLVRRYANRGAAIPIAESLTVARDAMGDDRFLALLAAARQRRGAR